MQYKASSITNKVTEDMAANTPVKIGTRGTVGSLVMREIDYFSKLEIDRQGNPQKPQAQIVGMASSSSHSRPSLWFLIMTWKRKKRRSRGFLPSACSVVEVAERNRMNGIPGFNYRILKNDANDLHG